ncbi:hypothetical protein HPB49_012094 [Dermacentor silvarum]|uniref:Uncharacterized protein n=1 Tax=Dermacentor silvarum TaxID=543639 RepID=A0ACB8CKX8_DERSI|nr:hypothetical protein HPB49_012094 [Dermacentor silvarum]
MLFMVGAIRLGYSGIVHSTTTTTAIWMILCVVAIRTASGVQIVRLSVPTWVENGTEDSVLLDCEYAYTERDDSQLVVKWFLNDDPKPIYQWIPELETRHVSQRLKGRLNTDFTVTANHFTKFRALNLLRPTTELSGRYSSRPKHFVFNFSRAAEESATTFVCEATGAFPLPTLALYQLDEGSSASPQRRHALAPTQWVTPRQDGSYVTRVSSQVPDEQFSRSGRHLFVCLLSIPGTDFKNQRLIEFYPVLTGYTLSQPRTHITALSAYRLSPRSREPKFQMGPS